MKKEIQKKAQEMITLGGMAGDLVHELNTPIVNIRLLAEGAIEDLETKNFTLEEIQESFGNILNSVNKMAEQVKLVRNRIEGQQIEKENISLNIIIEKSLKFFKEQLDQHFIHYQFQFSKLPILAANATRVEQIFINLIQNSKDSLDQLKDKRKKEIRIATQYHSKRSLIQVFFQDNGGGIQGIDPEEIFHSFVTTKTKGMGLGLSIVKDIVLEMGGTIKIHENSNLGVTFLIEIIV